MRRLGGNDFGHLSELMGFITALQHAVQLPRMERWLDLSRMQLWKQSQARARETLEESRMRDLGIVTGEVAQNKTFRVVPDVKMRVRGGL